MNIFKIFLFFVFIAVLTYYLVFKMWVDCQCYKYSTCPSHCDKRCISTFCVIWWDCVDDCDGEGSCYKK